MIVVQLANNRTMRDYVVRMKVSDRLNGTAYSTTNEIVNQIETIAGVTKCVTDKYTIEVQIAPSFEWLEVEASLLPMLHQMNETAGCSDKTVRYLRPDGKEANSDGSIHCPIDLHAISAGTQSPEGVAEGPDRVRIALAILDDMRVKAEEASLVHSATVAEWLDLFAALFTFDNEMLQCNMARFSKYLEGNAAKEAGTSRPG